MAGLRHVESVRYIHRLVTVQRQILDSRAVQPGELGKQLEERIAKIGGGKIHKQGFYHDGRFATLQDVVEHYNAFFGLGLTPSEMNDLIEYLKSI